MRWIRRLFLTICLILTGVVIWLGIYARTEGFTDSWRNAIEREFEKRGYVVEIGKITLGAFRGLVAEDVKFYHDSSREREIAVIDDVYLDVDLSKILNKEILINTLDVDDASILLPLDPSDPLGKTLKVDDLSGRIVITESMIEIVSAAASVANVDIDLSGTLLRSPNSSKAGDADEKASSNEALRARRFQLQKVVEELERFEFLDGRPQMMIEFRGDLDDLATMTASARIVAGRFRKKGQEYEVEGLEGRLNFDGLSKDAEIESLHVRDGNGEFTLTGQWAQEVNRVDFELASNSDITNLIGLFWTDRKMGEVVFFTPPEIKMKGFIELDRFGDSSEFSFPGEVIGQFHSERFVTRGAVFSGLDFGFSAEGQRFYMRNLRLDHKSGVAFANLKYEPGNEEQTVRYQAEIKMDPKVFRPFVDENARQVLDAWDFNESSAIYVAAVGQGPNLDSKTWENKGVIDLRNCWLNGVPFREMESEFESQEGFLWFRDVTMAREEGKIIAELAEFDVEELLWDVKGVVSTVDLVEGARAFNPVLASEMMKYQFDSPPTIRVAGVLDARTDEQVGDEIRRNEVSISFACEESGQYDFLGKTLELNTPRGEIKISGAQVHLTSFSAGVLGGGIELEYEGLNVRSSEKPYNTTLKISRVPVEAVTRHYGDTEVATGEVDAVLNLSGFGDDVSRLNGYGAASIENGELFDLPMMGALAGVIQISSSSSGVAKEAQGTFKIENGVLTTDDFVALTDGMMVGGAGSISLVDYQVDVEAVVNTRGTLSRTLLTPVSELMTFSASGTVHAPVWKAKHISNLGKVPAQLITEVTNIPLEGLKMITTGLFGNLSDRIPSEGDQPSEARPGEGLRMIGKEIFGNQGDPFAGSRIEFEDGERTQERPRFFYKFQGRGNEGDEE